MSESLLVTYCAPTLACENRQPVQLHLYRPQTGRRNCAAVESYTQLKGRVCSDHAL